MSKRKDIKEGYGSPPQRKMLKQSTLFGEQKAKKKEHLVTINEQLINNMSLTSALVLNMKEMTDKNETVDISHIELAKRMNTLQKKLNI
eukprot:8400716-Ditylum_brightwellii.AAC.1